MVLVNDFVLSVMWWVFFVVPVIIKEKDGCNIKKEE
jgi:hypothetical protein